MSVITRFFSRVMSKQSFDLRFLRQKGYELLEDTPLGEGSYAKVRKAYSRRLKIHVAVKIVDRRKAPHDFLQRFLPRELSIIQTLEHQHIIRVHEVFDTGEKVYVIMDVASGGDLLEYVKKNGFVQESLGKKMFLQILQAVKYCHENGVLHRDLKCENVLLDERNNVKITDFGFARHYSKSQLCKTFCGSAAYAAFEILKGTPYDGEKSDVWSMGVVLYTMLTGKMPFDDSDMKLLIVQIKKGVTFSKTKQQVSDECKDLIRKMLYLEFKNRITVEQIESHPWLATTTTAAAATITTTPTTTNRQQESTSSAS